VHSHQAISLVSFKDIPQIQYAEEAYILVILFVGLVKFSQFRNDYSILCITIKAFAVYAVCNCALYAHCSEFVSGNNTRPLYDNC
jgi:hypothetical protein